MYSKPVWGERRAELERFIEEGKSLRDMADYYGVKPDNVGAALKRLGLKLKPEDVVRRQRERMGAIHNDPEKRAKWIKAIIESNKSPEKREHHRKQMLKQWESRKYRDTATARLVKYNKAKAVNMKAKKEYDEWFKSLPKFEQQLELVRTGRANLVPNWRRRHL